jgi:hypothetical protein
VHGVQQESGSGPGAAAPGAPSPVLRNVLIAAGIVFVVIMPAFFLIARPVRKRRQRELKEAKSAAQDDLIALSAAVTGHHADLSIQASPEAAGEQGAALSAYERGTAALDAARRATDMGAVSRAIAEGTTIWPAPKPLRPASRGPPGGHRASSTRGTACR